MSEPLAAKGELSIVPWPPSGGVLLVREGDELNDAEGMHLSKEELRWLAMTGAVQAWLAVRPAVDVRGEPTQDTVVNTATGEVHPVHTVQGSLLGDDGALPRDT